MSPLLTTLSLVLLVLACLPAAYLLLLALAAVKTTPCPPEDPRPRHRFMIAIPAHDEGAVIATSVRRLRELDYPTDLYTIHIMADHCSDDTALLAQREGAFVHERKEGPRSGKGAALSWLFNQTFESVACDAIVIFDADTIVDSRFLKIMDAHLSRGDQAIQGQHIIRNPQQGWFPALSWAMFLVDNRFQNQGRSNLGWSAKHMGDSICFCKEVLQKMGWGSGLTEDFQLRQRLLLENIRIVYEPAAKGYGEAPLTWQQARRQRARWLRGTFEASRQFRQWLWQKGLRTGNLAMLDGALQASLPSYSTLTLASLLALLVQVLINLLAGPLFAAPLLWGWLALSLLLFLYPFFGLLLEKAPPRAYLVMLSGPIFILWRTWLAIFSRFFKKQVAWQRTEHGQKKE